MVTNLVQRLCCRHAANELPVVSVLLTISPVKREEPVVSKRHLLTASDEFHATVIANVRIVFNDRQNAHILFCFT